VPVTTERSQKIAQTPNLKATVPVVTKPNVKNNMLTGLFSPSTIATDEANPDILYKVIIIGDQAVGKSSILGRWKNNEFLDASATLGVELSVKIYNCHGKKVKIQMWDTAGQEKFKSMTQSYYRGALGVFLVYDVTNRHTFENIKIWINDLHHTGSEIDKLQVLLIGNKIDLEDRQVSQEEGIQFAKVNGFNFLETSAKSGDQCLRAFQILFQDIHSTQQKAVFTMQSENSPSEAGIGTRDVISLVEEQKEENTCPC